MKNPMFAFAACLRHAFMSGAGYEKDHEPIEVADLDRWVNYDPPNVGAFKTMADVLAATGRKEFVETMHAAKQTVLNTEEFEAAMRRASEAIREVLPVPKATTGVSIVAAAIKFGEIVISIPRPGRHSGAINKLSAIFNIPKIDGVQGFLTSAGTFVDREMALDLAVKSGQYRPDACPPVGKRELFSEDLW
jgi:hypothetical protein